MKITLERVSEDGLAGLTRFIASDENALFPVTTAQQAEEIRTKMESSFQGTLRLKIGKEISYHFPIHGTGPYRPVVTLVSAHRDKNEADGRVDTRSSYTVEVELPLHADVLVPATGGNLRTIGHIVVPGEILEKVRSLAAL